MVSDLYNNDAPDANSVTSMVKRLQGLDPRRTAVFSDLTQTILQQKPGGFPESQKMAIKSLLDRGVFFSVVTGDRYPTVKRWMLEPLGYQGDGSIFVIAGSGYQVFEMQPGVEERELCRGREVTLSGRRKLLAAARSLIHEVLEQTDFEFSAEELSGYFSAEGARYEFSKRIAALEEAFFVELAPNKLTLIFPDHSKREGVSSRYMKELALHPDVVGVAQTEALNIISAITFLDVIASTKEEGMQALLSTAAASSFEVDKRDIVLIGDSTNDEGLLNFPFPDASRVTRVFVGSDEHFYENVLARHPAGRIYWLKGQFVEGTELVLRAIGGD